jgi:tRNA A37 methylthiotransferase MiaB
MSEKLDKKTIQKRAEILGQIASECEMRSLEKEIGKTVDIVIDGESEESEFILSAKELAWAPDIDGELYVNDREVDEDLELGKIYKAKITELVGNKLLCTVDNS